MSSHEDKLLFDVAEWEEKSCASRWSRNWEPQMMEYFHQLSLFLTFPSQEPNTSILLCPFLPSTLFRSKSSEVHRKEKCWRTQVKVNGFPKLILKLCSYSVIPKASTRHCVHLFGRMKCFTLMECFHWIWTLKSFSRGPSTRTSYTSVWLRNIPRINLLTNLSPQPTCESSEVTSRTDRRTFTMAGLEIHWCGFGRVKLKSDTRRIACQKTCKENVDKTRGRFTLMANSFWCSTKVSSVAVALIRSMTSKQSFATCCRPKLIIGIKVHELDAFGA